MDEPVVEVSRVIRPFLHELVGQANADELDRRIASILNGWSNENTAIELRAALESHEATRYFMEEVLDDAPDFAAAIPAVDSSRIPAAAWGAAAHAHGEVRLSAG